MDLIQCYVGNNMGNYSALSIQHPAIYTFYPLPTFWFYVISDGPRF